MINVTKILCGLSQPKDNLHLCGGNFRVRALAATGNMWAPDPACYLTDEEIASSPRAPVHEDCARGEEPYWPVIP